MPKENLDDIIVISDIAIAQNQVWSTPARLIFGFDIRNATGHPMKIEVKRNIDTGTIDEIVIIGVPR